MKRPAFSATGVTPRQADLILLGVAAVWGATFPVIKDALSKIEPFTLLTFRFSLAALCLLLFAWRSRPASLKRELIAGVLLGLPLGVGYGLQTVGLKYTSAGKAGFLTGLCLVFVPVLSFFALRERPTPRQILGVVLALAGLGMMSATNDFSIGFGDTLVIGTAFLFAVQIVLIPLLSKEVDPTWTVAFQTLTVVFVSSAGAFFFDKPNGPEVFSSHVVLAVVFLGIAATAIPYWIQFRIQPFTEPSHAAVILSQESAFSVLFAWLWLGELMSGRELTGAALMFVAFLVLELKASSPPASSSKAEGVLQPPS